MHLSIVVPTLNEAPRISSLLERLERTQGVGEVIVADGGSTDGTPELVRPPVRLVRSQSGRGIQLGAGAKAASGDVLLFLHADAVPPPGLAFQIRSAVEAGYIGGNFHIAYSGGGLLGRFLETLAPFYRRLGRYYGDSGIFVRRDVYERVGGFPQLPVMEDVVFVRRMEEAGETTCLPGPMVCSPRRWEGRPLRTLALWAFMQVMFDLGASPLWLAKFYQPHKKSPEEVLRRRRA
jgi:rSAM/selenodomain-associated transferase 2